MVVLGIDLGTSTAVISAARNRQVEVCVNELSKRQTPICASFSEKERFLGDAGKNQMTFNSTNTVTELKRLIGKKYSQIKDQLSDWTCKLIEGENDTILIEVEYLNKVQTFTPVQVLGMCFDRFKSFIQKETQDFTSCSAVVSVPGFFTDEQRLAVMQACEIAQITVLRLINEASASALVYGVYNEDLVDDKPTPVCIVDVGHYNTSFTIVNFTKSKFHVQCAEYIPEFGAGVFERVLYDYFVVEIQKKYKLDVLSNPKAQLRLKTGCEKLKKVLSANTSGQLRIECLMEDTDVSFNMERQFFEDMCLPLFEKLKPAYDRLFRQTQLLPKDVSVQLIGGGSYIPMVRQAITDLFQSNPGSTINATESISRGCGIAAATISNKFKFAKEFELIDAIYYPIELAWHSNTGGDETGETNKKSIVFKQGDKYPNAKLLRFKKQEDFAVYAQYSDDANLEPGSNYKIAKFLISGVSKKSKVDEVKLTIEVTKSGIVQIAKAEEIEEKEIEVEEKIPATKEGEEPKIEKKMKKVTEKRQLTVTAIEHKYSAHEIAAFKQQELDMRKQDDEVQYLAEVKNSIEAYIYDYMAKVDGTSAPLYPYGTKESHEAFMNQLNEKEEWLGGEGEEATKEVYEKVLKELHTFGDPLVYRKREHEDRPAAIATLQSVLDEFNNFVNSTDEKYAHISEEDRNTVKANVQEAQTWLQDKIAQQDKLPLHVDPIVTVENIKDKAMWVQNKCNPIKNKPKPKEEKKPEVKEEAKPEQEAKTEEGDKMEEEKPAGDKMDVE